MSVLSAVEFEQRAYAEAGQWVRLGNTITFGLGSLFVPLSLGALLVALDIAPTDRERLIKIALLCIGSVLLFSLWLCISWLFRATVVNAREVAMAIEENSGIPLERSFYRPQKQPGQRFLGLWTLQVAAFVILLGMWGGYIAYVFSEAG